MSSDFAGQMALVAGANSFMSVGGGPHVHIGQPPAGLQLRTNRDGLFPEPVNGASSGPPTHAVPQRLGGPAGRDVGAVSHHRGPDPMTRYGHWINGNDTPPVGGAYLTSTSQGTVVATPGIGAAFARGASRTDNLSSRSWNADE